MSATSRLSIPFPRRSTEDLWSPPTSPPEPPAGAHSLLVQARSGLEHAQRESRSADRYLAAYLAAVRGSTAIIAARSRGRHPERPASVWRLLVAVAPELRGWADLFSGCAERRTRAEAGVPIPGGAADVLMTRADEYLEVVGRCLLETPR